VEEERKESGGSACKKTREGKKMKMSKQIIAIKTEEYDPNEITYFGKGVVTTKWFHAAGRRDAVVLAKVNEAADKFF
jgi:hypothetical protein